MGLLARIFGLERRDALAVDPYWSNWFAQRGAGMPSADNVISSLAVASRCIQLRSELLASVPLLLFRRTPDGGRERAEDNPLFNVLHDTANDQQSAFEVREYLIRNLDLYGNAYARIERNARGQVTALWPYIAGECTVERLPNGRLRYRANNGRRVETLLQEEILHLRGPTRDGIFGWSVIQLARGALTLALTQQVTAQSMNDNGLRPSGLLSYQQIMTAEQKDYIRTGMADIYAGSQNAGRLLVADAGAKYEKLTFSPEDSQFLEQRKLSNEDTARIFGVPPTSVGILDKATYSNVEQESTNLVQNCLAPLSARIEAAMQRCLLSPTSRRNYFIEHSLDGLLRGDVRARFESYRLARETGVFSANDVRRRENEPPIASSEGGDLHHMPANWIQLGPGSVNQNPASSVG